MYVIITCIFKSPKTETLEPGDYLTYLLSVPDIKLDSLMKAMQSMDPLKSKISKVEYFKWNGFLC